MKSYITIITAQMKELSTQPEDETQTKQEEVRYNLGRIV
jgi:hypothetical protein